MAKSAPNINVIFRETGTLRELGHSTLPMDQLPRRFKKGHGVSLMGERFKVIDYRPGSKSDWVKKGKVVLLVEEETKGASDRLVQKITPPPPPKVVKPIVPLVETPSEQPKPPAPKPEERKPTDAPALTPAPTAVPRTDKPKAESTFRTRCGFVPKPAGKLPTQSSNAMVLLPSEWRQIELIGKSETLFLEAELEALRTSTETYERMAIRQPLGSQFTVQEFIQHVLPGSKELEGVVMQGQEELAEDSFALIAPEGAEIYGTQVAGFVFTLGFRKFPTQTESLHRLGRFMRQHDLVLVQWVRARVLEPGHFGS